MDDVSPPSGTQRRWHVLGATHLLGWRSASAIFISRDFGEVHISSDVFLQPQPYLQVCHFPCIISTVHGRRISNHFDVYTCYTPTAQAAVTEAFNTSAFDTALT